MPRVSKGQKKEEREKERERETIATYTPPDDVIFNTTRRRPHHEELLARPAREIGQEEKRPAIDNRRLRYNLPA